MIECRIMHVMAAGADKHGGAVGIGQRRGRRAAFSGCGGLHLAVVHALHLAMVHALHLAMIHARHLAVIHVLHVAGGGARRRKRQARCANGEKNRCKSGHG
ncbi:hypothetical protein D3C84_900550 [compost metagenome]